MRPLWKQRHLQISPIVFHLCCNGAPLLLPSNEDQSLAAALVDFQLFPRLVLPEKFDLRVIDIPNTYDRLYYSDVTIAGLVPLC